MLTEADLHELMSEHTALLRSHGALQRRCTAQAQAQATEIARLTAQAQAQAAEIARLKAQAQAHNALQAQLMRLRARLIVRETELLWLREDQRLLAAAASVNNTPHRTTTPVHLAAPATPAEDSDTLARSLRMADLVICQTGCISQGDYWRVRDHCKRTGKACVLVTQPDALRIAHLDPAGHVQEMALAVPATGHALRRQAATAGASVTSGTVPKGEAQPR